MLCQYTNLSNPYRKDALDGSFYEFLLKKSDLCLLKIRQF